MIRVLLIFILLLLPSCRPQGTASLPKVTKKSVQKPRPKPVVAAPTPVPEPQPVAAVEGERFLICLDPGHGGEDPGTRRKRPPFLVEKKLALAMALQIEKNLVALGYKVVMTRRKDSTVPLPDRVSLAKRYHALLFVSIHCNWTKNTACRGVEVFFFDKRKDLRSSLSRKAAEKINRYIVQSTPFPSRGVKHGNFCVLRETDMPAVLVETGFFSNAKDVQLIRQSVHRVALAKAIAKGIDEFCRMER